MNFHLQKINELVVKLDEEAALALQSASVTKEIMKGEFLLRQGDVCRNSFLIKQGVARKFYLDDGKEITTELFFENDLAVAFESYSTQKPGREFIQAVTDISISQTDYQFFQNAKKHFPQLEALDLLLTEYYAIWLEERLFQFHTMDARQRYLLLMKDHPHFIQQVPLTIIASYLGISLETLSRIRAKL
jgi:CRP-like cAMP-binding protein